MADYDFEAWAQARVAPSKPNPNQQAAASMLSVGIGGLGGKAITSSAQRIQDSFREMRENSRTSGSTNKSYFGDINTAGLGSPLSLKETEKKDDRNLDQKIYDGMKAFGARLFPPRKESTSDYVLDVYETSPMFRIPTVPEVTELGIEKSFEQKMQEMFSSQGQNVYTPEIEGTGSNDEVPATTDYQNLMRNRINSILKDVIAPNSKEYEIQKGDTLSDISLREGVSVDDLAKVNEIENPNMILAGGTLIIPEAQEMEKAKEYVLRVTTRGDENLVPDPERQFYQSGVPLDKRVFEPELGYGEVVGSFEAIKTGMDTADKNLKGLGVRPEVTVTELDDDYVAAEDTTRTPDDIEAPDYATMNVGEEGRPDIGIMTNPKDTRYFEAGRGNTTETGGGKAKTIQKRLNDLDYNAGKVDGAIGGGSKRAIRKFQKQHGFEPTGNLDAEQYNLLISDDAEDYPDPTKTDAVIEKLDPESLKIAREALAFIESSTHGYSTYAYNVPKNNKKKGDPLEGGSGNHYLGRYQMGRDAMIDGGYLKNDKEYNDEKKKMRAGKPNKLTTFLNTPSLQDKAWKKYTDRNHDTLTKKSERYRNMSMKEKLGVLGYAHNQGATAAVEWLFTGVSGADANGTLGTKYTTKIANAISDPVYGIMP